MNAGNLWLVIKLLVLLSATAALFGYFGWWLRHKFHAPVVSSTKPATVPDDLPARERVKKLEHSLSKSEAEKKALKHDLETLQSKTISKLAHEKITKELAEAQHRLESDLKRIQALETDLKKSRDTVNTLNSNAADANKGQRERTFALENELSKVREALSVYESRPDNTLTLQAEVDRLREALTNATRVIGDLRKQETAAVEAMNKAQKKLEAALAKANPEETGAVSFSTAMEQATRHQPRSFPAPTPIDIVAETQAEANRFLALNAQKEAERLAAEAQVEKDRLTAAAAVAAKEKAAAAAAKAEQDRIAAEAAAAVQAEQDRLAAEAAASQAEQDRLAAEAAAAVQAEQDRLAAEAAAAQAEQDRLAAEAAAAAQVEQDRLAAEAAAAAQAEQDRLAAEAAAAAQAEQDRLAAAQAEADAKAEQEFLAAKQAAAAAQDERDRLASLAAATSVPVQADLFSAAENAGSEEAPAEEPGENKA